MNYLIHSYRYLFAAILLCTGFGSLTAQQVQMRLITETLNCQRRQMAVSLEIKSDGDPISLGTSSILLEFDPAILRFTTYEPIGFEPTFTCSSNGWAKQTFDGSTVPGALNITAHLEDTQGSCPQLHDQWIKFGTIFFEIRQEGKNPSIDMPMDFTIFNASINDGNTLYGRGTVEIDEFTPGICNEQPTPDPTPAPTPTPTPTPNPTPAPAPDIITQGGCEPVFSEWFGGNLKQWTNIQNAVRISKTDKLQLTNNEKMFASYGLTWEDLTLEVTTSILEKAAGIIFRYEDENNHYLVRLEEGNKVRLMKRLGGSLAEIAQADLSLSKNTEYRVVIVCQENTFSIAVDGQTLITISDDSFVKGAIGFSEANGEKAEFDNVSVCVPQTYACDPVSLTTGGLAKATQSSSQKSPMMGDLNAAKAIDGDFRGDASLGTVSVTTEEKDTRWEVDLGTISDLSFIRIWNREDCCQDELQNAYVFISDFPFESKDIEETKDQDGVTYEYFAGQLNQKTLVALNRTGRFVRIQLEGQASLNLAEVEVLGCVLEQGGLLATYYNSRKLTSPVVSRVDRKVDFNWGTSEPHLAVRADNFSVRWQGELTPPVTGPIYFRSEMDEGARLWVNNQEIFNDWARNKGLRIVEGQTNLVAGEKVPIRLEYYDYRGNAQINLQWKYEGQDWQTVPSAFLQPKYGGLLATYYNDMELGTPMFSQIDRQINFDWRTKSPHRAISKDRFSVRWEGMITPMHSEVYTFSAKTDDGVRLWINDELIIDKWVRQAAREWSGTIDLVANQPVSIKMEYYDQTGRASAKLYWESATQTKEIIPSLVLEPKSTSLTFGEVGVAQVSSEWQTITLERTYEEPVVILGGITFEDESPTTIRVRNVQANSFEVSLQAWYCEQDAHKTESMPYIVVESGLHFLPNGGQLYAGHLDRVGQRRITKRYPVPFKQSPVVLANTVSMNSKDQSVVKVRTQGSRLYAYIKEGEAHDNKNASERVAFLACSPGIYGNTLGMEANQTGFEVDHNWTDIPFGTTYDEPPVFVGAIGSVKGGDPAMLRYQQDETTGAVKAMVQEETCGDNEQWHALEEVHYLAFIKTGLLETPAFQTREGKLLVDGLYLYAYPEGERVQLEWTINQEQNIESYVLESSVDKQFFRSLSTTPSQGDSEQARSYQEFDNQPFAGINYYRVKAVGKDGTTVYSNTVRTSTEDLEQIFAKIYPNPVHKDESLSISLQVPDKEWVEIDLFTTQGQSVRHQLHETNEHLVESEMKLEGLPVGIYYLRVMSGTHMLTRRVIIE